MSALVRGIAIIIRIRNGIDLKRLMIMFIVCKSHLGIGRIPFFSPATRRIPIGRPITMANAVERIVTYKVSQIANGNSVLNISRASETASEEKALFNKIIPIHLLRDNVIYALQIFYRFFRLFFSSRDSEKHISIGFISYSFCRSG